MSKDIDAVVTMLPSSRLVSEVVLDTVMPVATKPVLFVDCSTVDVKTTKELARQAAAKGHAFVDAPVSGGFEVAQAGQLSFMAGRLQS